MQLTPELINVLKITKKTHEAFASKRNAKFPKFEYYTFDFRLNGIMFKGKVNIGVKNDGSKVFYEINNIRTIRSVSSVSWKESSYSPNVETNNKVSAKSIPPFPTQNNKSDIKADKKNNRHNKQYSLSKDKSLIAINNIGTTQLEDSLELGGLPVSSIAILNSLVNYNHESFGDISLVFDIETIDLNNKQNKMYSSDVYSGRFPRIAYKYNEKYTKELESKYGVENFELENAIESKYIKNDKVIDNGMTENQLSKEQLQNILKAVSSDDFDILNEDEIALLSLVLDTVDKEQY